MSDIASTLRECADLEWINGTFAAATMREAAGEIERLRSKDQSRCHLLIPCPECDGSAVKVTGCMVYEHGCGFPHRDTDEVPCPECDGTGTVEIEGEPITLEDLEITP